MTRLRYGDGCTERRHLGNGSDGTRFGCWRRGGRRRWWAEPWSGIPIRLANGLKPSRRAVPKGWFLSRLVVPPRVGRGATSRVEGGGAAITVAGGYHPVQLELEGSAPICGRPLRVGAEPQQLPELPAPVGVCDKASQEAVAQSRPSAGEAFVGEYAALMVAAARTGILFADRGPL